MRAVLSLILPWIDGTDDNETEQSRQKRDPMLALHQVQEHPITVSRAPVWCGWHVTRALSNMR